MRLHLDRGAMDHLLIVCVDPAVVLQSRGNFRPRNGSGALAGVLLRQNEPTSQVLLDAVHPIRTLVDDLWAMGERDMTSNIKIDAEYRAAHA
jgi:hypothetical protein